MASKSRETRLKQKSEWDNAIAEAPWPPQEQGCERERIARERARQGTEAKIKEAQVHLQGHRGPRERTESLAAKKAERLARPKEEAPPGS